jgi:putative redox protein
MARITVTHRHDESFDVRVRGYALIADEPVSSGGDDEGPTPTELMVAGLAACAAEEAVRTLAESGEPYALTTEVDADFTWDAARQRVGTILLNVKLPDGMSKAVTDAVKLAVLACPARKMLTEPPTLHYEFGGAERLEAASQSVNGWPREAAPDADAGR